MLYHPWDKVYKYHALPKEFTHTNQLESTVLQLVGSLAEYHRQRKNLWILASYLDLLTLATLVFSSSNKRYQQVLRYLSQRRQCTIALISSLDLYFLPLSPLQNQFIKKSGSIDEKSVINKKHFKNPVELDSTRNRSGTDPTPPNRSRCRDQSAHHLCSVCNIVWHDNSRRHNGSVRSISLCEQIGLLGQSWRRRP